MLHSNWGKRQFILLLLTVALCLTGCGITQYSYSVVSNDVYLAGEYMRGPSPRAIDIELTLSSKQIKNGTDVSLDYFGTHYHGTVKDSKGGIVWDKTPEVVADGVYSSSAIENYNSGIKLTFFYYIEGLEVKDVLLFSEK